MISGRRSSYLYNNGVMRDLNVQVPKKGRPRILEGGPAQRMNWINRRNY